MSQASRSHALARVRWREQVARLYVREIDWRGQVPDVKREPSQWARYEARVQQLLQSPSNDPEAHFDVHAAREFGRSMVAMAAEQAVFEDWCRARGKGPGNRERGSFVDVETDSDWGDFAWAQAEGYYEGHDPEPRATYGVPRRGGWPGNLARQYADAMVGCKRCEGGWLVASVVTTDDGPLILPRERCPKCRDQRQRYTQAPVSRSIARVGQRLLDMLDGRCPWAPSAEPQTSECRTCVECTCDPKPDPPYMGDVDCPAHGLDAAPTPSREECPDCKGTGHNLRGFVPEVEWPAVVRRKAVDGERARHRNDQRRAEPTDLVREVLHAAAGEAWVRAPTRVVPRGEHRNTAFGRDQAHEPVTSSRAGGTIMRCQVTAEGEVDVTRADSLLPRWRRGELRHEQQRGAERADITSE